MGRGEASSDAGPWVYALDVEPGVRTLVATDHTRIVIRRDISVTDSVGLDNIDLSQGTSTIPLSLLVSDLGDDPVQSDVFMLTNDDLDLARVSGGPGLDVRVLPSSALAEEQQLILVRTGTSSPDAYRSRGLQLAYSEDLSFALMPRLVDEISTDNGPNGAFVRWERLPIESADRIGTYLDDGRNIVIAQATAGWLALHGADRIELDKTMPGFDPNWQITIARHMNFQWTHQTESAYGWTAIERPGSEVNTSAGVEAHCRFMELTWSCGPSALSLITR
jgi:hypothetical protein